MEKIDVSNKTIKNYFPCHIKSSCEIKKKKKNLNYHLPKIPNTLSLVISSSSLLPQPQPTYKESRFEVTVFLFHDLSLSISDDVNTTLLC